MSKKNIFLNNSIISIIISVILISVILKPSIAGWEAEIIPNSEIVSQYALFEISFKLPNLYKNPFDPEEIDIMSYFISPSGKVEQRPAFWYHNYRKETITREVTKLRGDKKIVSRDFYFPKGEPEWKVRYAPMEMGEYQYYLIIQEGGSDDAIRHPGDGSLLSFISTKSDSKGNIKVSENDPHYFAYENGETFLPIGHGPEVDERKLIHYAESNFNIVQTEFNRNFLLEHERIGYYDLERAFIADKLLEKAEDLGIYFQVVFNSWPEWAEDKTKMHGNAHWDENVYNKRNGGLLNYPFQFDSNDIAMKYFKNKLRYYIARWGYSTNVFAWYLWGEHDMRTYTSSERGADYFNKRKLIIWHKKMSEYIKSLDSRHLVSTAEASKIFKDIWELDSIDFITVHNYIRPVDWQIIKNIKEYQSLNINKPILIQEYGPEALLNTSNLNENAYRVGYHNPLWQTILMKLSGAPMKWTWYGDPREQTMNLDRDYQILYDFFNDSDLANSRIEVLQPIDLSEKQYFKPWILSNERRRKTIREGGNLSPVEIYGIGNNHKAYLWVHDIRYNSFEIQNTDYRPQVLHGIKFQLNNMTAVKYQIEFWNTRTGDINRIEVEVSRGSLNIEVPSFRKDIAIKVTSFYNK